LEEKETKETPQETRSEYEQFQSLKKTYKKLRIFTFLLFLVFSASLVLLICQNQALSEELFKTKIEAAFTYNMLKYAVALNNAKDDNDIITAKQNYIQNYYFLMAQIPDENISSIASQMALCFNERDALLEQNKTTAAFVKQQECQKLEEELEQAFYTKMQKEGFDEFLYTQKPQGGE